MNKKVYLKYRYIPVLFIAGALFVIFFNMSNKLMNDYIVEEKKEITTNQNKGLININTADIDELISLPGIGSVIAERIIDVRNEVGGFESLDELLFIEGIRAKTFEGILTYITID